MIEIDDNGDFVVNENGNLKVTSKPNSQCAKAETRCQQGEWFLRLNFGRNFLVWTISQSTRDRSLDLYRISQKYVTVGQVLYDSKTKKYEVVVLSND